jgi:hypothetical protein
MASGVAYLTKTSKIALNTSKKICLLWIRTMQSQRELAMEAIWRTGSREILWVGSLRP